MVAFNRPMFGVALLAVIGWGLAGSAASAQDSIVGIWWSPEKDAKVEIWETNGVYFGRLIAGAKGRLDEKNPNRALRNTPLLGQVVAKDLRFDGTSKWGGGTFYDPNSGTTYRCTMWLDGRDRLMMRGFFGISLLGRTVTCERVVGANPRRPQPGEPDFQHLYEK